MSFGPGRVLVQIQETLHPFRPLLSFWTESHFGPKTHFEPKHIFYQNSVADQLRPNLLLDLNPFWTKTYFEPNAIFSY